jgi:hypothetical protein
MIYEEVWLTSPDPMIENTVVRKEKEKEIYVLPEYLQQCVNLLLLSTSRIVNRTRLEIRTIEVFYCFPKSYCSQSQDVLHALARIRASKDGLLPSGRTCSGVTNAVYYSSASCPETSHS